MEAPWKRAKKWTASSSSSSSTVTDLPSHILVEIMLRLPIKTIVATKCVCKSWLQLINDPQFAKLHQATAKVEVYFQSKYDNPAEINLYLANLYYPNGSQFFHIKLNTLLQPPLIHGDPNDLCIKPTWGRLRFVNSCNGLLCYVSETNELALIWNPITSEFITLPAHDTNNSLPTSYAFGFGFSQKANRFKLLCMMGDQTVGAAKICTIEKACSWKTIGHCANTEWRDFGLNECMFGSYFLQGALHWTSRDIRSLDLIVVSFDFEDEKFGRVPLPPHMKTVIGIRYNDLGELAGCLFVTESTNTSLNIWLMKEYGVQDSWTKVISLNFSSVERNCCRVISFKDNGEILMLSCHAYLFVYNPVLKSTRVMGSGRHGIRAIAYSPSLVRLKDSTTGFEVHAKSRCAGLEHRALATTASWWESLEEMKRCGYRGIKIQENQS